METEPAEFVTNANNESQKNLANMCRITTVSIKNGYAKPATTRETEDDISLQL